jgi:hypothetical protein
MRVSLRREKHKIKSYELLRTKNIESSLARAGTRRVGLQKKR